MKIGRWSDWILRMESDRFIMAINKNTGEYKNFYNDTFENPIQIKHMALLLDRHKDIE